MLDNIKVYDSRKIQLGQNLIEWKSGIIMRAESKSGTSKALKEDTKQISNFDRTNNESKLPSEINDENHENRVDELCPFLRPCHDLTERLLQAMGDRNIRKVCSVPHQLLTSVKSSRPDPGFVFLQQRLNLDGHALQSNQETAVSISPWHTWDYLDEIRWSNSNRFSTSNTKQQPGPSEAMTFRTQSTKSLLPKTNDRKRWEVLWKDSQMPDIAYQFQHYTDIRRYIEQYRQERVHKRVTSKPKNEELLQTTTLSVIPPLHSFRAPVDQRSFQDPTRLCLTQRAFRFSYTRQATDLSQRTINKTTTTTSVTLGCRGQLLDQLGSVTVDSATVRADRDGAKTANNILNCFNNNKAIGSISLPRNSLMRVDNRRNNTELPEFLTTKKKTIASNTKEVSSSGLVVQPAVKSHSPSPSTIEATLIPGIIVQDAIEGVSQGRGDGPEAVANSTIKRSNPSVNRERRSRRFPMMTFPMTTFIALSDLGVLSSPSSSSSSSSSNDVQVMSSTKPSVEKDPAANLLFERTLRRINPEVRFLVQPKQLHTTCRSNSIGGNISKVPQ